MYPPWGRSQLLGEEGDSSPSNRALLSHTLTHGLCVCHCLHNLFSLPVPTPATTTRGAQGIFRAKHFHVLYPTFSTAVRLHTYSPMKMEQCVQKRWHLNYRRRGITQKKAYIICVHRMN